MTQARGSAPPATITPLVLEDSEVAARERAPGLEQASEPAAAQGSGSVED